MTDHRAKRMVLENTYQTKLSYKENDDYHDIKERFQDMLTRPRFPVGRVKSLIQEVLQDKLAGQVYQSDQCSAWTKEISDEVKNRIKELKLNRYKIMVQTMIGEKRGQGMRFGTRTFWDANTDAFASESFSNENLFAVVVAYGVWTY